MPRYAALIYGSATDQNEAAPDQWARIMAEYNDFGATAGAAGVISGGEALQDTSAHRLAHHCGAQQGAGPDSAQVRSPSP